MKPITLAATILSAGLLFITVLADVKDAKAADQCGKASWYQLTSMTASGEYANPTKMTAAHLKLKFGTRVQVKNMKNGKSVVLRINDRGPFIKGRIIDVTRAAASKLGFKNAGTANVCLTILKK